jgi:hypothetical protein
MHEIWQQIRAVVAELHAADDDSGTAVLWGDLLYAAMTDVDHPLDQCRAALTQILAELNETDGLSEAAYLKHIALTALTTLQRLEGA